MNPKNALLTTSARAKRGDALLGELLPPEILEQTPDFLKQKLLGCMGTIGIINSKDDEWNLKKQIVAAVDDFNHNFSGGRTPDPGPVVTALVKMLDAPMTAMRQMLSGWRLAPTASETTTLLPVSRRTDTRHSIRHSERN